MSARSDLSACNPNTRYGRRKARRLAQVMANDAGRRVFLQVVNGRYYCADDGRGPLELEAPWREFYPQSDDNN